MDRALVGESCPPAGEESFVAGQFGDVSCRVPRKGQGRAAELGVFGRVAVGVSVRGELSTEVLDFLLGELEGALGLIVFLLLSREGFGAFGAPGFLLLFLRESLPDFVDSCEVLEIFLRCVCDAFGVLCVAIGAISIRLDNLVGKMMRLPSCLRVLQFGPDTFP